MTATIHEVGPYVEIFSTERQHSLVGLSAEDFHAQYDDFSLLLVRLSDQVVVAGCRAEDRQALGDRFQAEMALDSLTGYAFEHGPAILAQATEGLSHAHRESQRRDTPKRSR